MWSFVASCPRFDRHHLFVDPPFRRAADLPYAQRRRNRRQQKMIARLKFARAAFAGIALALGVGCATAPALADGPDLILRKSTVWKFLTPDDKLAVYGIDDPVVNGVACHYTVPEKGGVKGMLGVAEEVSDISIACRQVGPISFTGKFEQGDVVYRESRSLIFKKMQIVRGCDVKRNVLVYLVYTDKLIEGSPKNSTSSVPIMPWGTTTDAPKCGDYVR
jgi:CreA protein